MARTYYYQGSEILTPLTITSNEPHFDVTTISLKTERTSQEHQRWELSFNVVGTKDTEVDLFLNTIVDFDTPETMIMPQIVKVGSGNNQEETENTLVNAADVTQKAYPTIGPVGSGYGQAGNSSVIIDNASSTMGYIKKGTFIKFSNHDKVYITTNNLNMSGTVNQTLNVYPKLRENLVHNNTTLQHTDNCLFKFFKSIDNLTGITYTDGILSNIGTISLVEAL